MKTWSDKGYNDIARSISKEIMDHHSYEQQTRSFHFRTPSAGSMYAFSLTWSPGSLMIAGDIGEMVITHYHALAGPAVSAFAWLKNSHPDYLLGKSNAKKVYDREATWETLKCYLDDEVRDIAKHYRDECYEARAASSHKHEWAFRSPSIENYSADFDYMRRLNEEFGWGHDSDLYTSSGRRGIREEIREFIMNHDHDEVARGLSNAGFDDYYGSMKWDHSAIVQITAIQFGATKVHEMLLREYELQEAKMKVETCERWVSAGMPTAGPAFEAFRKTFPSNVVA